MRARERERPEPICVACQGAARRRRALLLAGRRRCGHARRGVQGALAASVMSAGPADPETPSLVAALTHLAGRVAVDDWPTGVAVTWAQQHGGPWPATTSLHTSVGATALRRFLRPVVYQDAPAALLPAPLRDAALAAVPHRRNGVLRLPSA